MFHSLFISLFMAGSLGTGMTMTGAGLYPVSYDLDKTFKDRLAVARLNPVDPSVTEERFADGDGCGTVTVSIELAHFDERVDTGEALRRLAKQGLRPANFEELVAFAAGYPQFQEQFPIAALGKRWKHPDGVPRVAVIGTTVGKRKLDVERTAGLWGPNVRFAAVRIEK
jgi:hypothetical protein